MIRPRPATSRTWISVRYVVLMSCGNLGIFQMALLTMQLSVHRSWSVLLTSRLMPEVRAIAASLVMIPVNQKCQFAMTRLGWSLITHNAENKEVILVSVWMFFPRWLTLNAGNILIEAVHVCIYAHIASMSREPLLLLTGTHTGQIYMKSMWLCLH